MLNDNIDNLLIYYYDIIYNYLCINNKIWHYLSNIYAHGKTKMYFIVVIIN